jgi:hypothetical protein
VVAFIELLLPRSPSSGLARVVIGLCIIAMLFDIALDVAADPEFDLELDVFGEAALNAGSYYVHAGEALAQGTVSVVQSGLSRLASEEIADPQASTVPSGPGGRQRIDVQSIQAIAQVKVGGSRD